MITLWSRELYLKADFLQISDRSVDFVVEVEALYEAIPGQEPVIHMRFVSVSYMDWVSPIFRRPHSARNAPRYGARTHKC
jgi:hypothetical protein